MKRTILAGIILAGAALATPAKAVDFTISEAFGNGNFGTATAFFVDPAQTIVHVDINMAPNFIIDSGVHYALTLSLLGTGRIDESSLNLVGGVDVFTSQLHGGPYDNSPFHGFTDAVASTFCTNGGSTACGSVMSFNILDFQGFGSILYDPDGAGGNPAIQIYAAVDISCLEVGCTPGSTGPVGLTSPPLLRECTPETCPSGAPAPIVGAGIPGLIASLGTLVVLARRRRRLA